jgi:hypothetical protein
MLRLAAERRQRRQRELGRIKRLWAEDVDEFERRMVLAALDGEAREHQAD